MNHTRSSRREMIQLLRHGLTRACGSDIATVRIATPLIGGGRAIHIAIHIRGIPYSTSARSRTRLTGRAKYALHKALKCGFVPSNRGIMKRESLLDRGAR